MAKGTNTASAASTTNTNGLKLYPKLDIGESATETQVFYPNSTSTSNGGLGSKVSSVLGQLGSNPGLLSQLGVGLFGTGMSIPTGQENRTLGHNQITASYYRNPYLQQALGQKTDMSDYYADFMNNLYLNKIAQEAEKARQRKLIEADTDQWYDNYTKQTEKAPLPVISGGSGIHGLDAMEGTIV